MGAGSTVVGAVIGLAAAVLIGWLFYTGSRRINLRTFFTWTGVALVFIAAGLLSHAVHEFIEVAEFAGIALIGTQAAYDISAVLPDNAGIGQFLRAIFGYADSPEVLTLAGPRRLPRRDPGAVPAAVRPASAAPCDAPSPPPVRRAAAEADAGAVSQRAQRSVATTLEIVPSRARV